MNSEDPKRGRGDEEAFDRAPQPPTAEDGTDLAPMESEASGQGDNLVDSPAPESEEEEAEPLELGEPVDPLLPEIVADAVPDGDIVADAAETDPELTESAPASTTAEGSMPDADLESDLEGGPEEGDGPLEVEIELPSDAPLARSGSTLAETANVDTAPSPPADFEPTSEQNAFFAADATPVAESPADPSFSSEDFATAALPSSGEELSPPVFVGNDPPQSHPSSFDSQPTGVRPVESPSFAPGAAWPFASNESPSDVESFRMPPLLLEVSHADWEQRMEQLIERFATRVDKLVEERIEDKLSYRDHVQAAQMRALYWRG